LFPVRHPSFFVVTGNHEPERRFSGRLFAMSSFAGFSRLRCQQDTLRALRI
jgi:hypothetical protein